MLLPSHAEPMARALLESEGNAQAAVYALVKEANEDRYGTRSFDLLTCAKAIVKVNEALLADGRDIVPVPFERDIVPVPAEDFEDRVLRDLEDIDFEDDDAIPLAS